MTDISDAADLMTTAREALLAEILPALPDERRYVGLMIANVMAIAAREHRLAPAAASGEAARLRDLLRDIGSSPSPGVSSSDLPALRRSLCGAIRGGRFDDAAHAKRLTAELLHITGAWVAISNPKALRAEPLAPTRDGNDH